MKKQVRREILEDMKKYIKGFKPDDYERCYSKTDPSVISFVRDYYSSHLPVDVNAWIRVYQDKNIPYRGELIEQIGFVRDTLCNLFFTSYEELRDNPPMVISTYSSRKVKLPVYQINLKKYGVEIILRYDFYDWKISIKSDKPLNFYSPGLFNPTEKISAEYFKDFPSDKVYGSYAQDHSKFTVEINNDYNLYTFMFLLKNYLGIKKEE